MPIALGPRDRRRGSVEPTCGAHQASQKKIPRIEVGWDHLRGIDNRPICGAMIGIREAARRPNPWCTWYKISLCALHKNTTRH